MADLSARSGRRRGALFTFLAVVAVIGLIAFACWLAFRPHLLQVRVEDASLPRFELSNSSSDLLYSLSLAVSIRNPNGRVAIYYDRIEAVASYDDYPFGRDSSLPAFFQDRWSITWIRPVFEGRQEGAGSWVAETYHREKGEGSFYVVVEIRCKVRYREWFVKIRGKDPVFTCRLRLPAPPAGGNAIGTFTPTGCDVH